MKIIGKIIIIILIVMSIVGCQNVKCGCTINSNGEIVCGCNGEPKEKKNPLNVWD
jgi:deoxycytidylate deaminase